MTKRERRTMFREVAAAIVEDAEKTLETLRRSGAVPDGFEDAERASLPKIAFKIAADNIALSQWASREIKNMKHFA